MSDDEKYNVEFDSADAGTSLTVPRQCSALRKNGHVLLKGHPCKISEMSTSKTGKHGHAKVHLIGYDIFRPREKYEELSPSTHNMEVPIINNVSYLLVDADFGQNGHLTLFDDKEGDYKEDIKTPVDGEGDSDSWRMKLKKAKENIDADKKDVETHVTVTYAMGQAAVTAVQERAGQA